MQVKLGVESRVRAALSQATQLEAQMEALQEAHAAELSDAQQRTAVLEQDLAAQQVDCADLSRQLDTACQDVSRYHCISDALLVLTYILAAQHANVMYTQCIYVDGIEHAA